VLHCGEYAYCFIHGVEYYEFVPLRQTVNQHSASAGKCAAKMTQKVEFGGLICPP
jgi:hypothetical protein